MVIPFLLLIIELWSALAALPLSQAAISTLCKGEIARGPEICVASRLVSDTAGAAVRCSDSPDWLLIVERDLQDGNIDQTGAGDRGSNLPPGLLDGRITFVGVSSIRTKSAAMQTNRA
jgi:hypothetical protein